MTPLSGKRILLGVTGSIAAYKSADLASKLTQAGAQVDVILTDSAEKFIAPLTFQSVTARRAYTNKDLWGNEAHVLHVGLARAAELFIIAPCTANTLAKLAHGRADNLLTITALAAECPMLIAPAMDGGMFDNAATQENLNTLRANGKIIIGPESGHLASGLVAVGRMSEPLSILGTARNMLARNGKLAGKKIIITAGGTQEAIDPVRIITNHSSGKQGFALAQSALDAGAQVILVATPTTKALIPPFGAEIIHVTSAEEMRKVVLTEIRTADALIMAAAVADFRPKNAAENKIKKRDGLAQIELEPTADILAEVSQARAANKRLKVVVGFAAESRDLMENAEAKLKSKRLDFIAANNIASTESGFGVDTNKVTLLFADGTRSELELMSKEETAEHILANVIKILERL